MTELPHTFATEQPSSIHALERYNFGAGEVLRVTPASIRTNEITGEPISPTLYVQGMNGDAKLESILDYLADDGRQMIALRYFDKPEASPKPVTSDMRGYRQDASVPELDVSRADDLLVALHALMVKKVDIVAESAGATSALLVADALTKDSGIDLSHPSVEVEPRTIVNSLLLVDPAGQDGRTYRQTHLDALKLARAEKRNARTSKAIVAIAQLPKTRAIAKQLRDRPVQRAVAYTQTQTILADVAERIPLRVLSDVSDVAFRTERIAEQMKASGAVKHAGLPVQTDKGGHGVGLNKAALDVVIANLHDLE